MQMKAITDSAKPGEQDIFEMTNLYRETTGLPMTVWVSPRGTARHDVRIKANMMHGNQMIIAHRPIVTGRYASRLHVGGVEKGCAGLIPEWADRHGTATCQP